MWRLHYEQSLFRRLVRRARKYSCAKFGSLSPGQTIATCQCNISQHCWEQHVAPVWPPCCDVLRHVARCWVLLAQIWKWSNFSFVDVAWCCSHLARFAQQCCVRACALVRFSTRNTLQRGGQTRATMLRSIVAIIWPELANAGPTMLGYVMSKCRGRLAWA